MWDSINFVFCRKSFNSQRCVQVIYVAVDCASTQALVVSSRGVSPQDLIWVHWPTGHLPAWALWVLVQIDELGCGIMWYSDSNHSFVHEVNFCMVTFLHLHLQPSNYQFVHGGHSNLFQLKHIQLSRVPTTINPPFIVKNMRMVPFKPFR